MTYTRVLCSWTISWISNGCYIARWGKLTVYSFRPKESWPCILPGNSVTGMCTLFNLYLQTIFTFWHEGQNGNQSGRLSRAECAAVGAARAVPDLHQGRSRRVEDLGDRLYEQLRLDDRTNAWRLQTFPLWQHHHLCSASANQTGNSFERQASGRSHSSVAGTKDKSLLQFVRPKCADRPIEYAQLRTDGFSVY